MKRIAVFALVLVLAGCGAGGREARVADRSGPLDGLRTTLSQAFAAREAAPAGGGLCGDPALVGEVAGEVDHPRDGCGISQAVRLTQVGDVTLSQAALIDCETARALRRWLKDGAKPAVGKRGGGIAELRVAAHYVCRTRNHQRGARLSEHSKGRAIDISAITLRDGETMTVLDGWNSRVHGRILRKMHGAACGPFGTVLGPESDRFHQDHFHFDTARYRSGSYCR